MRLRRFQFSLRTLLLAMTLVCLAAVIWPPAVERYREWQREREFNELIELITATINPSTRWDPVPSQAALPDLHLDPCVTGDASCPSPE